MPDWRFEVGMNRDKGDKAGAELRKLKAKEIRLHRGGQKWSARAEQLDLTIRAVHGETSEADPVSST